MHKDGHVKLDGLRAGQSMVKHPRLKNQVAAGNHSASLRFGETAPKYLGTKSLVRALLQIALPRRFLEEGRAILRPS